MKQHHRYEITLLILIVGVFVAGTGLRFVAFRSDDSRVFMIPAPEHDIGDSQIQQNPNYLFDLNEADEAQLASLPGIGPAIAERIVIYRAEKSGFNALDELLNVNGIGEVLFAKVSPYLYVNP